jgi:hypothetical protein
MNEFGAKNLQTLAQLFDLLVEFFFYVGSFADFVSDMNVHESLGNPGADPVKLSVPLQAGFYTREGGTKQGFG